MLDHFWFSDEQWARLEPLLPRGDRGAHRVDDRRVLSGIATIDKPSGFQTSP
jgi:transposase